MPEEWIRLGTGDFSRHRERHYIGCGGRRRYGAGVGICCKIRSTLLHSSLTIDQGPGSAQLFLFRHAGITAFAGKRRHRLATGPTATCPKRAVTLYKI
jgi:hypothetical protein